MPVDHYENFPVASFVLPARLRRPVEIIYAFARQADDIADEGDASAEQRLAGLEAFEAQLQCIRQNEKMDSALFSKLADIIKEFDLPIQAFEDLLSAFRQDVDKTRYKNFGEVMDYCRRSANPVGRLLMTLFQDQDSRHLAYSDALCSSLQLINFLQDVEIDFRKNRIYFPLDELERAGIGESGLAKLLANPGGQWAGSGESFGGIALASPRSVLETKWRSFMLGQIERTRKMLQSSVPLGLVLRGRIGFETRMIIAGGDRILRKLYHDPMVPLVKRVKLSAWDWIIVFTRALVKR